MRIAAATASIKTTAFIDAFNALDDMEGIVRFRVPRAVAGDQKRNARRRPRRAFRNDPVTEVRLRSGCCWRRGRRGLATFCRRLLVMLVMMLLWSRLGRCRAAFRRGSARAHCPSAGRWSCSGLLCKCRQSNRGGKQRCGQDGECTLHLLLLPLLGAVVEDRGFQFLTTLLMPCHGRPEKCTGFPAPF
jgi:hypothetical protein